MTSYARPTVATGLANEPRPATRRDPSDSSACWATALAGLFCLVFAVVALSGPGRIDIGDGQTRYEVARSLVEHGDSLVRDEAVWFNVFPGRDGRRYTPYRFPQSVAGVAAIWLADLSGPVSEPRRQFFFTLMGAVACGLLAVAYGLWFRGLGLRPPPALAWAAGGVFCTPNWFYGTSTFDENLASLTLVSAVAAAWLSRRRLPRAGSLAAGLLLGILFNCKPPLALFLPAVLVAGRDHRLSWRAQWPGVALVLLGLAAGMAVYKLYDLYKYPPGTMGANAELLAQYCPMWPGYPLAGFLGLTLSPGAGAVWYCPPVALSLAGAWVWFRRRPWFCRAMLWASMGYLMFVSTMSFFAGDPAWGPRYLTPIFAVLWVFAPAATRIVRRRLLVTLLSAGVVVQVAALAVDHHRLYIERRLPSSFFVDGPWLYFHPAVAHLLNRPREIVEILLDSSPAEKFTPTRLPTWTLPVIDHMESGPDAVRRYRVLNSLRPWWICFRYLPAAECPVDLAATAAALVALAAAGLAVQLAAVGVQGSGFRVQNEPLGRSSLRRGGMVR